MKPRSRRLAGWLARLALVLMVAAEATITVAWLAAAGSPARVTRSRTEIEKPPVIPGVGDGLWTAIPLVPAPVSERSDRPWRPPELPLPRDTSARRRAPEELPLVHTVLASGPGIRVRAILCMSTIGYGWTVTDSEEDWGTFMERSPWVPLRHIEHVRAGWPWPAFQSQRLFETRPGGAVTLLASDPCIALRSKPGGWVIPTLGAPLDLDRCLPIRPIWAGALADTAFFAALPLAGFGALRLGTRLLRLRRGLCPCCGYNPFGLPAGAACPECGKMLPGTAAGPLPPTAAAEQKT